YEATEKYTGDVIELLTTPVSVNLNPFTTQLDPFPTFIIPATTPGFDNDSMVVNFGYILNPAGDINHRNDTLHYEQEFYNYFAYDDGTAERAYSLEGTGSKLALRFYANEPDTLKEIYIHWAYDQGNSGNLFFSLLVWDNIDTTLLSAGENIVFQNDFLTPKYIDSINGFYVYELVDFLGNPTPVVVDGYFYVGWLQSQDDFLNVGFDANNDAHDNVFYNVGGAWLKSSLPGAIMIRPQVGGNYSIFGPVDEIEIGAQEVNVYPNPANNIINIDINNLNEINYKIFNQSGQVVSDINSFEKQLSIADLPSGFFILKMNDLKTGVNYFSKFVKY
ncbi:MAG: T9SS type A sorting domain-containing protein, partial [Chitinophagales bacterium]